MEAIVIQEQVIVSSGLFKIPRMREKFDAKKSILAKRV